MKEFFDRLTDAELLARLIYGEARGEGVEGMVAVAQVAMNRAKRPSWWGKTLREVILKPYQFSCFNGDYVSRLVTPREKAWLNCLQVAVWILDQHDDDDDTHGSTHGATHYHAVGITPHWAASLTKTVQIGSHLFYR